jgi:hypothetical protein
MNKQVQKAKTWATAHIVAAAVIAFVAGVLVRAIL